MELSRCSPARVKSGSYFRPVPKYPEADNAFKKIEASGVGDARVAYYEAFVHAMMTGDWRGEEVTRLAGKGASLEKAGKPAAAEIDAAFADLQADLKPWLAFSGGAGTDPGRRRATRRPALEVTGRCFL